MRSGRRSAAAVVLAAVILAPCVVGLLCGCGHKEEAPPPNYYSGPMKPKGSPGGVPGAAKKTAPASNID